MLHLTHALVRREQPDLKLQAVYITEDKAFPQVNEFVQQSITRSVSDYSKEGVELTIDHRI